MSLQDVHTIWELVPPEANYVIKDEDGIWYWFKREPEIKKPSFFNIFGKTRLIPEYEVLWRHRVQMHNKRNILRFVHNIIPAFIPIRRPDNCKISKKKLYKA